jgi:ankyrin repeat protein
MLLVASHVLLKEIENNNMDYVKAYIEKGSDLNIRDVHGNTPLHYAAYVARQTKDLTIFRFLLAHNKINVNAENNRGSTPLHIATGASLFPSSDPDSDPESESD